MRVETMNGHLSKQLGSGLTLGFGYFALASVSILLSRYDGGIAAIWLANAFAIAFVLIRSVPLTLSIGVVAVASASANAVAAAQPVELALLATLNAFEFGLAVVLIRWWLGDRANRPELPEQAVAFFALAAVGAPLVTAALAALAISPVVELPASTLAYQWLSASFLGAALVIPPMMLAGFRNTEAQVTTRQAMIFAATSAGAILVACVALGSYLFPFFAIGLYLLITAVFLTRFEVALVATVSGAVAIFMAVAGLIPGFADGAAAFADRFQISLGFALVFPVFVSILLWRLRGNQERLAESEELFRRAMEDSAVGMAIVELDGRITKANRALAEMLGYSIEELEADSLPNLTYLPDKHLSVRTIREVLAGRQSSYRFEKRYVHKNGTPIWVELTGSVIRDSETGEARYVVSQIENIDERKNAQQAVVEAENRWNFALSSARQGVWDLNVRAGRTYYSPIWKEMLGYADDELGDDPDLWLKLVHPDDRARALELDEQMLNGESSYFEGEFRMQHKDGSWVWVLDRGRTIERDADGNVVRAIGTHTDITVQKQAQARIAATASALRAEKERLRVTLHAIGDAVICTDASDNVSFMNAAAEALTGLSADQSIGQPLATVYCPRDEETNEVIPLVDHGADGSARTHDRAVIVRQNGTRSSVRQVVSAIVTEGEVMNGSIIVAQDITDARTLQRQLAYAASHDSLTGLANRANFLSVMRELLEETRDEAEIRHQLLFIDLDRFKTVNDRAGHGAGDVLLKRISEVLRNFGRSNGFVARLGGDEFALILKHVDVETAVGEAEKIVAEIAALDFVWEGERFKVGASVGVASLTPDCRAIDEVIANADRGCYSAKAAGRGTVSVHSAEAA